MSPPREVLPQRGHGSLCLDRQGTPASRRKGRDEGSDRAPSAPLIAPPLAAINTFFVGSGGKDSLSGGPILHLRMAIPAARTPSFRSVGSTSSPEAPQWLSGKLRVDGRRVCPSRQLRRRSRPWSSSGSDYTSGSQVASRSKQIDGRSCIGNANLLKLGGLPARPLKENTVGYFASESHRLPEAGERAVALL